jgi:hypothetical protein
MRKRIEPAFAVALWMFVAAPVAAQRPAARLTGTVTSVGGEPLTGVTVRARNRGTGSTREVITDADGSYEFSDLPADGAYDVQAQLTGFSSVVRENVTIPANGDVIVDLVLRNALSETVAVTAHTPPIQHDRATVQQIVGERLVRTLPLIGRDFLNLASLTAGFTGNPSAPSPQGQIYWSNNVLVDGGSHFSKWRSAARTFYSGYSLESIKEVQVLTSQFSAEFGEALATVTNVVTNSGTNELHGAGLIFVQDSALNDVPVFAAEKPPAASQRFGLTLGGPIVRNQTHFFASYEGWRSRGRNIVVSPAAEGAQVPNDEDQHLLFWKLDQRAGERHALTARYNGQWFRWHNENGGLTLPGSGTHYQNDVHTLFLTDTVLFSNQLISQPRFQFARYVDVRRDLQPTVYMSRAGYSIEGGALGPWGFGADPEDTWEAADTFSYVRGVHSLKFGGGLKYVRAHNTSLAFGHGAFFFAGAPSVYTQPFSFAQGIAPSLSAVSADPRSLSGFGYIQDDWRVGTRLTLNIGGRYDAERISNVGGFNAAVDKNNFQPRIGAAWDPTGAARTVLRGGVGFYTQQHLLYYINRVQLEGPQGGIALIVPRESPLMPAFPTTLPSTIAPLPPRDIHSIGSGFRNPYSLQAAAGIEHTFHGTEIAVDYIHLEGRDLMSLVDVNAPASIQKPAQRTVAQADATRPAPPGPNGYRKIFELENHGRSWYHGLQIKVNRTIGTFRTLASYTLARAKDQANYQIPEDSRNVGAEKGPADNDIRHNVSAGFTWDLPGDGLFRSGWTVSGLGMFRSGRPYTMTWGDDRNGTTQNDARPAGRNTLRGDTFRSVDLALTKRFSYGRGGLELRAEAFNILSATNYDEYVGALSSFDYGRPISAFPRRRIQLAAIARF